MKRKFQLGEWQVEPDLNRLVGGDGDTRLQPQQMDLLCRLAADHGQVVSRETLIEEVWRRGGVNDEVLSRSIAELRSALGDDAKRPRYIETIPRRGYRLLIHPESGSGSAERSSSQQRWVIGSAVVLLLLVVWFLVGTGTRTATRSGWSDPAMLARQVTSLPGQELDWTMSTDGQLMAFVSYLPGATARLMLRGSLAGEDRMLVESQGNLSGPAFSPDGQQLAWAEQTTAGCLVMLLDLERSEARSVADCWTGGASQVAFSADGLTLAFSYTTSSGAGIGLLDLATQQVRRLTQPPGENRSDIGPQFSPSGTHLSFSRGDEVTRELYLLALDSNEPPRQLTREEQLSRDHSWIDESTIVFASDRQARQALWVLSLDDGKIQPLGAAGAYGPYYSQSEATLYYERSRYRADIWSIDLGSDQQMATVMIDSSRYDNHPVFSPDGQTLAFISNRSGLSALWLARADGTEADLLYEVAGARVSRPAWSADGKEILVTVYGASGSHLVSLNRAGQVERLLVAGNRASAGQFGPAGRYLYYLDERNNVPEVWRLEYTGTDAPEPLGSITATRIQVAADGSVYYTRPQTNGVFVVNADGSDERQLMPEFPARRWTHWCVAGTGLYYAADSAMMRLDLVTAEVHQVSESRPQAIGITVGVDAAETHLLITRTESAEVDIMAAPLEPLLTTGR